MSDYFPPKSPARIYWIYLWRHTFGPDAYWRPKKSRSHRARKALSELESPGLDQDVALCRLRFGDHDLLEEEAVVDPECLRLQKYLLDLESTDPFVEWWKNSEFGQAPIARLWDALLAQAVKDGDQRIWVVTEGKRVKVRFGEPASEREVMEMPGNLWEPARMWAKRLEALGIEAIRPYMKHGEGLPSQIWFEWPGETELIVRWD